MNDQPSMANETVPHPVRIQASALGKGSVEVGGHDVTEQVYGFDVSGAAGAPTQIVLHALAGQSVDLDLEGVVTVVEHVEGAAPQAISDWLSRVNAGSLEQAGLQRADLDLSRKHGMVEAMLRTLSEWARGEGTP